MQNNNYSRKLRFGKKLKINKHKDFLDSIYFTFRHGRNDLHFRLRLNPCKQQRPQDHPQPLVGLSTDPKFFGTIYVDRHKHL